MLFLVLSLKVFDVLNWTISLIAPERYLKVTAHGDFVMEDCIRMKEDFIARDFWKPGMNVLIDYRETAFPNLNLDILREIGKFHESKNEEIGGGRMAFLMKSPRDFGFARQYEMITEDKVLSEVCVFLEEGKALRWLLRDAMSASD